MKIKAKKEFQASLNGFEVISVQKGAVLDVDEMTAKLFTDAGFCEGVVQKRAIHED